MWGLRSKRILHNDRLVEGILWIEGETIQGLTTEPLPGVAVEDLGDQVVMAGGVDTHVHINEPGRTVWEGFSTATKAALVGGMTTLIDMPLNSSPVTTTKNALAAKRQSHQGKLFCDVGFWAGVIPGHLPELAGLLREGTFGGKAFLCDSGIDEFPAADWDTVRGALEILKTFDAPLLAHAEIVSPVTLPDLPPSSYRRYLLSRPPQWEIEAIEGLIALCRETQAKVHIVHLATAEALPRIAEAKKEGLPLTVETCPHYLCLTAEAIQDGQTVYKCAPPIRDRANCEALWEGLESGLIDFIASDHSPCPPEMKDLEEGSFQKAWGGISSLDLGLPLLWTAMSERGLGLERLASWLSAGPSRLAGLERSKGSLDKGKDADLIVWAPEETWVVQADERPTRHKLTPYLGQTLKGRVKRAYLRGRVAYNEGRFSDPGLGEALKR